VYRISLGVVIVLAFSLRIWALNVGLPPWVDPDEQQVVCSAMGFGSDATPRAPNGNVVATYLSSLSYAAYYGVGRAIGRFDSFLDFGSAFFHAPRPFYMIARLLVLAAGLLSVYLAFLVGLRLRGRSLGLVLSMLVAVHPLAIEHAHQAQSHGFAVALILFGCWVVLSPRRGIETIASDLTFGFCLGLATEAMPACLLLFPAYLAYRAATPRPWHPGAVMPPLLAGLGALWVGMWTVGTGANLLSAAWGNLGACARLHLSMAPVWLAGTGMLVLGLSCLLHRRLPSSTTAAATLAGGLLLVWPALRTSVEYNAVRSVPPPTALAATWISQHLPTGSTIVVDPDGLAGLDLRRTGESWRRELTCADVALGYPQRHSRAYCLVGMHAAGSYSGPAFDVVLLPTPRAGDPSRQSASAIARTLHTPVQYIVTSQAARPPLDLLPLRNDAPEGREECWLVARFAGTDSRSDGVTIWATPAAVPGAAPPEPVPWLVRQAPDLALLRIPSAS